MFIVVLDGVLSQDGGLSALMVASKYGHSEMVKLLLEYKADVNLQDDVSDVWSSTHD